jgi:hypothetical protein
MVDVGSKALFYCDECIVNLPAALHPESANVLPTYTVWVLPAFYEHGSFMSMQCSHIH